MHGIRSSASLKEIGNSVKYKGVMMHPPSLPICRQFESYGTEGQRSRTCVRNLGMMEVARPTRKLQMMQISYVVGTPKIPSSSNSYIYDSGSSVCFMGFSLAHDVRLVRFSTCAAET
jgi:hypothetical protein